jgi:hypothetical protein
MNYIVASSWHFTLFHDENSGHFFPQFRDNLSVPSSGFKNQESYGWPMGFNSAFKGLLYGMLERIAIIHKVSL